MFGVKIPFCIAFIRYTIDFIACKGSLSTIYQYYRYLFFILLAIILLASKFLKDNIYI